MAVTAQVGGERVAGDWAPTSSQVIPGSASRSQQGGSVGSRIGDGPGPDRMRGPWLCETGTSAVRAVRATAPTGCGPACRLVAAGLVVLSPDGVRRAFRRPAVPVGAGAGRLGRGPS